MAEEAPATAPTKALAKAPRKKSTPKVKKEGPSSQKLIVSAVADCKEWKGVSLAALKKALVGKGVDVNKANKCINTAVTMLVIMGTLSQIKGTSASGSFKLSKKEPAAAKQAKKVMKKALAKAKKPAAKKTTTAKKHVTKKPKVVKKSPKKVTKTTKKVAPKKPKAVKECAAKKTGVKKPTAK